MKISEYKKSLDFKSALKYFKEEKSNFSLDQIKSNSFIISDIITCLRKSGYVDPAFQFVASYTSGIEHMQERVLSSYGWLLYIKCKGEFNEIDNETEVNDFTDELESLNEEFLVTSKLIGEIKRCVEKLRLFNKPFNKTLISNLFQIVIKFEKAKINTNWNFVNDWCNDFSLDELSDECFSMTIHKNGRAVEKEFASAQEFWFVAKSKALLELGKIEECIELSSQALDQVPVFHSSNDVWLSRNISKALTKDGDLEKALQIMNKVHAKKRDWFIKSELAELNLKLGKKELALKLCNQGLLEFGRLSSKVKLVFFTGKILEEIGDEKMAREHFKLCALIRRENDWNIPNELENMFTKYSITLTENSKRVAQKLKGFWTEKNKQEKAKDSLVGKIVRVLNDNERGKDGFLKVNSKNYYFSVPHNYLLKDSLSIGSEVKFEIKVGKNSKEKAHITKLIAA